MTREAKRKYWHRLGIPAAYALPVQREAQRLVPIGRAADDGKILKLVPLAAIAWKRMQAAAAMDGVTLLPLSAFRSVGRQAAIIRRKLAVGQPIAGILRLMAAPGCSEHHTGRAVDIGSPAEMELSATFARTPEFRWLKRHAAKFGFHLSYPRGNRHGIAYEPWHWCWQPKSGTA